MRKAILYGPGMFQQAYKFHPRRGLVKGDLRTIHIQQEEFVVGKERCMGIFGNDDRHPGPEEVDETERILKEKGKDIDFYRYDGAGHGIWYYDKPMYRQAAAMDSFNKALEFFDKYLK